jgi:hypothetical protein
MTGRGWLVLRRAGCLWAVPAEELREVRPAGEGVTVVLAASRIVADEVLGLRRDLDVVTVGRATRGAVPVGCTGMALCDRGPLLVVDPAGPPRSLLDLDRSEPEGGAHDG